MSVAQKIADIEAEIARTQRNKATEYHLGLLKAKLSKFKRELIEGGAGGKGGGGEGFDVSKTGDARIGLIGFPSVGKSTLLTKLTGTFSEAADYEFTTLTCVPGVIRYKGAKIQLLDLPGIIEGAKDGKGRGRQVIAVGKTCGLILIVLDATKPLVHKKIIERELEGFGIRLNKNPPNIVFRKKDSGGITITKQVACPHLNDSTIKSICREFRTANADIMFRSASTADDLIDVIQGKVAYIPAIYVINKIDAITIEELDLLSRVPHYVPISAGHEWNFDGLMAKIWQYLNILRVYTKPRGQPPDYDEPVCVPAGKCSIEEFCNRIHKQIMKDFKYALVWGKSVKHFPQKVGKDHHLMDEDIVQIVKRN